MDWEKNERTHYCKEWIQYTTLKAKHYSENKMLLKNQLVKNSTMYVVVHGVKNGGNLSLRIDVMAILIRKNTIP